MATEDPFSRTVDRILEGLYWHCQPDPYRLIPGECDAPDRWAAKCPFHVDTGYSLLLTATSVPAFGETWDGEVDLWCRAGCPESWIRYTLVPDPERDREAARRAETIVWAQTWRAAA